MAAMLDKLRPKTYSPHYPRSLVGRPLLFASSALASLGDAMFGYSQGVIAAAQVQPSFINRMYGKNVTMADIESGQTGVDVFVQAIVVACLNLTALLSSLVSAYICDHLGRRMSVRIGGIIYLIASLIQLLSPNLSCLVVGRCFQGLGVGILSMTVPILQCEIAPTHGRGQFVAIEYLCLNSGYALASWVGFGFFFAMPNELSWRGPYIIQASLAVILIIWTFYLPETPRWLIKNGFPQEGLQALADLNGNGDPTDKEIFIIYKEIVAVIEYEETMGNEASWRQIFGQYTRRSIVGITCQMFAQLNGINAILYFLPTNLTRAGFSTEKALLYSGACAIVYCAGTIPTLFGIDRWGRRKFLLSGSFGLATALAVVGGLQYKVDGLPVGDGRIGWAHGIFAAVCVYLFVFGATWGPTPWLLGAEIFPLRARAKGMALSTCSNWFFNFIVAFITPPLFAAMNAGYYFLLVSFCLISAVLVALVYPETKGRSLEELGEVFGDKVKKDDVDVIAVVEDGFLEDQLDRNDAPDAVSELAVYEHSRDEEKPDDAESQAQSSGSTVTVDKISEKVGKSCEDICEIPLN